jgi:hypothetical protein
MPTQIDPLTQIPDPETIHRRLDELVREEQLLLRLLRLALTAQQEQRRRAQNLQEMCAATA